MNSPYFSIAFAYLVEHEGGYNNIEQDAGGATNYGISLRFLQSLGLDGDVDGSGHVDADDIRALTEITAADYYEQYFWYHYGLGRVFAGQSAAKLFGMLVNMRSRVAGRAAQRALRAIGYQVVEDGILGSQSINAINSAGARAFVPALKCEQAGVYRRIVEQDPSQELFLDGWLRRAYDSPV